MKNIKYFDKFFESDNLNEFEAGLEHDEETEFNNFEDLSNAIDNLSNAIDNYIDFEEGEKESDVENIDLLEHDENEIEILNKMKDLVNQLYDLKEQLIDEEDAQDADEVAAGLTESKKHPGFKKIASKIAKKQGISKERASAILASSSRKASAKAKRKNPRLNKVKGCKPCGN